jgi:ribose 5-phosphate isomerase A
MDPKQRAAEAAIDYLSSDSIVGLGTGSTAQFFLRALAAALKSGRLKGIRGVPTSKQSHSIAHELGIPLLTFTEAREITVTVDGADEIDPKLNLIKGLGGALLREKVVAQNSKQLIIIADESKCVAKLGSKSPLPVEVTTFGHEAQERFLRGLGSKPTLRQGADGKPFVTDNGNYIYDCRFEAINDPGALQDMLGQRAGVVETGLFLDMANIVLIGNGGSVKVLKR